MAIVIYQHRVCGYLKVFLRLNFEAFKAAVLQHFSSATVGATLCCGSVLMIWVGGWQ